MTAPITDVRKYYDLGHQGDVDWTQIDRQLSLSPGDRLLRHQRWAAYWRKPPMDPDFTERIVTRLLEQQVEFLIVGGICAVLHGSPRQTLDLDLCYRRTSENLRRLVLALAPLDP